MPGGTYYTPQDIADEMVADALSGWTERKVGGDVSLHDLFHPAPRSREWENLTGRQLLAILKALEGANILDPCCGSGVFTVAALQGLWRARKRLLLTLRTSGDLTERTNSLDDIIEHNLFATDSHPLAVLITRLRIFIALVDIRGHELKPLPNLDTRIVAANTLCVNLGGQLSIEDPGIKGLIGDLGAVREAWTTAYRPEDKKTVLNLDGEIRAKIHNKSDWGSDDESEWLAVDLLYPAAPPANMDIRLLFPKPDGWDIVIGNPPYQQPDLADTFRGNRLSYIGAKTNLYLMFMEAALNVARRGGVVTLIVPHSIIFQRSAKAYERVRNRIEHLSERVDIRTYDNRPQPVFPQLPWLKAGSDKTNRQRVTIVRILLSGPDGNSEQCAIYSRGLLRLSSKDRLRVLRSRLSPQLQPRTPGQWTQAPTRDLALLLKLMREEKPMITSGRRVTISKSAMYFITCLPAERLANPSRKQFFLARDEFYWAWIGLYNSHLFHAYWLMMGNHMDLTSNTYASVRSPEGWNDKALLAKTTSIAKMLTSPAMIGKCRKVYRGKGGKEFPNCDFHDHPEGEALIEKLDRLLLQAYGLPEDPLLSQMHTIRTGSAHQLQKSAPSYN